MKTRIVIVALSAFVDASFIWGEDEEKEKVYTQKEFDTRLEKMLKEGVEGVIKKIRPKSIAQFSQQLLEKEERLRVRELQAVKREEQLQILSNELEGKIRNFKGRQEKFLACADEVAKKEDDRVKHMVDVVGAMRPQNAADVLSVQDMELAVKIMAMLKPDKISKIFNLMDKEISARLQKHYLTMKK